MNKENGNTVTMAILERDLYQSRQKVHVSVCIHQKLWLTGIRKSEPQQIKLTYYYEHKLGGQQGHNKYLQQTNNRCWFLLHMIYFNLHVGIKM